MKKYIIILLILSPILGNTQDRNVFWTHGLGDDADFWNDEYARAERNYKINSSGFTYPTNQGISAYADRIRSGSYPLRGSQTIAIGHSMGGVAIREADRDNASLYGGMITFGAPLDGARIANEARSGGVNRFITQSMDNLRRGPIASQTRSKWQVFIGGVTDAITGGGLSVIIRSFASAAILDITDNLTGGFQQTITNNFDPTNPSVKDLAEGSAYFNTIRNYSSSKPKIFAWGDENSPVHMRMFTSSITQDDNFAELMLTAYNTVGVGYRAAGDGINTGWFPWCWNSCRNEKRREKEAWYVGYDYLNRGWEVAWNQLTDARVLQRYTTTERVYECSGSPLGLRPIRIDDICPMFIEPRGGSSNCNNCRWVNRTVTRTRWANQPSDGFIKRDSQIGRISAWGGDPARLPDVNHLEMGVHPETNELLRDAFNGGRFNIFFKTTRR